MLCDILDSHHSKLADFGEGVNFRWPERIASVPVVDFRTLTLREKVSLPGVGEGLGLRVWPLAARQIEMVRLVFGFSELRQFYSDAGLRLRTAASSPAGFPTPVGGFRLPLRIAKIINFESIKAS